MVDPALDASSALGSLLKPGRSGRSGCEAGVILRERSDLSFLSIGAERGQAIATASALAAQFGITAPTSFQRIVGSDTALSWLGPNRWLIEAARTAGDREAALRAALGGIAGVTDESDGWVVLDIAGPRAIEMLAKLVPVDLDPRHFAAGSLALTAISHMNTRIWNIDGGTYRLAVFRSYAGSLLRAVTEAALEYGLEVTET